MMLMHFGLLRRTSAMTLLLLASACMTTQNAPTLAAFNCASNVPEEWKKPVEGAPLPPDRGPLPADLKQAFDQVVEERTDWQEFGIRERAAKVLSDNRTRDTISIVSACNAREAEVAKALAPRSLWQQLTPWRE